MPGSGRVRMRQRWYLVVGLSLVIASGLLYCLHYAIFRNPHHIFIYLLGDLAFLPLEVLVVALIVDRLLTARDKKTMLEKLNMVIGAFFSQVGFKLLGRLSATDPQSAMLREMLVVDAHWSAARYRAMKKEFEHAEFKVDSREMDRVELRKFLVGNRDFMLRLLENPLLLEHDAFTDLLRATFHLTEEFEDRKSLDGLPAADLDHLSNDVSRAYGLLARQWLEYMLYLKSNYPYLYSLAMRTNPFNPAARVEFE